jgi:Na+-transporting methylmalonyl-CoA/oxaloacetate decarboxylase gamma subunit
MYFDFELIERAAILTGIGMGTSFVLLILLMVTTALTAAIAKRWIVSPVRLPPPPAPRVDPEEERARALAAAIAVGAAYAARETGQPDWPNQ